MTLFTAKASAFMNRRPTKSKEQRELMPSFTLFFRHYHYCSGKESEADRD